MSATPRRGRPTPAWRADSTATRRAKPRARRDGAEDRTASASTHALGNTATAASVPRSVIESRQQRCAAHPHGTHNAPSAAASTASRGPALGSSQYCVTSTYPASPHHARIPPSRAVGAARTTSSSGVKPIQASHHHDGAGKANAGSAPTTNAAARPGTRAGSGPCGSAATSRRTSPSPTRTQPSPISPGSAAAESVSGPPRRSRTTTSRVPSTADLRPLHPITKSRARQAPCSNRLHSTQ